MRSLNDSRWVFFVRCGCAQSFDDLFSSNESIYVYVTLWNELDLNSIAPPVCIHAWIYATTISFHNFQTKIGRSFVWFFYFRSTSIKNIDAFAYTIFVSFLPKLMCCCCCWRLRFSCPWLCNKTTIFSSYCLHSFILNFMYSFFVIATKIRLFVFFRSLLFFFLFFVLFCKRKTFGADYDRSEKNRIVMISVQLTPQTVWSCGDHLLLSIRYDRSWLVFLAFFRVLHVKWEFSLNDSKWLGKFFRWSEAVVISFCSPCV